MLVLVEALHYLRYTRQLNIKCIQQCPLKLLDLTLSHEESPQLSTLFQTPNLIFVIHKSNISCTFYWIIGTGSCYYLADVH